MTQGSEDVVVASVPLMVVRGQFEWKGTDKAPQQRMGAWACLVNATVEAKAIELVSTYWEERGRTVTNVTATRYSLEPGTIIDLAGGDFFLQPSARI